MPGSTQHLFPPCSVSHVLTLGTKQQSLHLLASTGFGLQRAPQEGVRSVIYSLHSQVTAAGWLWPCQVASLHRLCLLSCALPASGSLSLWFLSILPTSLWILSLLTLIQWSTSVCQLFPAGMLLGVVILVSLSLAPSIKLHLPTCPHPLCILCFMFFSISHHLL